MIVVPLDEINKCFFRFFGSFGFTIPQLYFTYSAELQT